MLSQVGSITDNGVQQFGIACGSSFGCSNGQGPGVAPQYRESCHHWAAFPAFASIRVFSKDYANPRIYTANVQFEQQIAEDLSMYFDFTHSKGVHLTRFINLNRVGLFPGILETFCHQCCRQVCLRRLHGRA